MLHIFKRPPDVCSTTSSQYFSQYIVILFFQSQGYHGRASATRHLHSKRRLRFSPEPLQNLLGRGPHLRRKKNRSQLRTHRRCQNSRSCTNWEWNLEWTASWGKWGGGVWDCGVRRRRGSRCLPSWRRRRKARRKTRRERARGGSTRCLVFWSILFCKPGLRFLCFAFPFLSAMLSWMDGWFTFSLCYIEK